MACIRKIQRKKGTVYRITVSMGEDAWGKQIRHDQTWTPPPGMGAREAEREAQKIAVDFETKLRNGIKAADKRTFQEYAEYVLELHRFGGCKVTTAEKDKRMIANVYPYIGNVKMRSISVERLNRMYQAMSKPGGCADIGYYIFTGGDIEKYKRPGENWLSFADRLGVDVQIITRLRKGYRIMKKNADKIEKAIGKKLFKPIRSDKGYSPRTIHSLHGTVSTVFAQAEREQIIDYNPAKYVTLPKGDSKEQTILEPQEVRRLLDCLKQEPIYKRALFTMYVVTGCRRGEILALRWEDVDMEKGEITVAHSLQYLPEYGIIEGTTKTGNIRYVQIPPEVVRLLKAHRAKQAERRLLLGDMWQDSGYIFTNTTGGAINPTCVNSMLRKLCKKYELPQIHPHTFRHTAASILIANGIDPVTVADMLGHKDVTTTLDTYSHAVKENRRRTAECISNILLENNA